MPPILPEWVYDDPEFSSALSLILAPTLFRKGILECVDFEKRSIRFPSTSGWSHGERILLDIARHLYTGEGAVDLYDAIETLDDTHFDAVMNAILIRKGRARIQKSGK